MMIRSVTARDLERSAALRRALLALNNEHAVALSWLDAGRLMRMVASAFTARRIGMVEAFLIAFDRHADYDSPNYRWFCDRYTDFIYVDRVVRSAAAPGRGLAGLLYLDLIEQARAAGHVRIVCEVDSDPPNPASDAFHRRFGFRKVGSSLLDNGKTVGYLELQIAPASTAACPPDGA